MQFPEPTDPAPSRSAVLLTYLDYFRATIIEKVTALPAGELRRSRLPSGWTPVELVQHLTHVERRWLEWGFEDAGLADPWADRRSGRRDDRWFVAPETSLDDLVGAWRERGERTRQIVESRELTDTGLPGERWDGAPPATLERVLLHLIQEHARHAGHLDVVAELATGTTGE